MEFERPEDTVFDITMIATVLAKIPRFNGQTYMDYGMSSRPYTVAQHSVHVAELLPMHLKVLGLLHDAHEAFTGDMIHPLQMYLDDLVPGFKATFNGLQQRIQKEIDTQLIGCNADMKRTRYEKAIRTADLIMLRSERNDLLSEEEARRFWPVIDKDSDLIVYPTPIKIWDTDEAIRRFVSYYNTYVEVSEGYESRPEQAA